MDSQTLINTLVGIILAAGGWFGRAIWGAVSELRRDLHELEIDLPKTYATKHDFDEAMKRIEGLVQRIYDKLDGKQDK